MAPVLNPRRIAGRVKSRTAKPVTLPAVRPNEGLVSLYEQRLDALIGDMHASLLYWLRAAYRSKPPEMALDEVVIIGSPAMILREAMNRLARRWTKRFDEAAPSLAEWFSRAAVDRSDKQLAAILKKAGFSVQFRMTAAANDVFQATVGQNVGLIKSIASQHLADVQGAVMRSVQAGRDLGTLTQEIEDRYGLTRRRAALIARHQNNMATATITRVRQAELGIKQAVWVHSHAGAKPRPSHVKAGAEKVVYDVSEGWFDPDENRRIWPGELVNCRCVARPVIPGF